MTERQTKVHGDEAQGASPFLIASRVLIFLLLLKLNTWWAFTRSLRSSLEASPIRSSWLSPFDSLLSVHILLPSLLRGQPSPLSWYTSQVSLWCSTWGSPQGSYTHSSKGEVGILPALFFSNFYVALWSPIGLVAQDWKQERSYIRDLFFISSSVIP